MQKWGDTIEEHVRKSVQMHNLARYLTCKYQLAMKEICVNPDECFLYSKCYLGKIRSSGEFVTIEEFCSGEFFKFINNTGEIMKHKFLDMQEKAETLAHFSYIKSEKNLIITDIQGCGFKLFDPEIATVESPFDKEQKLLFCVGNLSKIAYTNFFTAHVCNRYCEILNLEEVFIQPREE